MLLPWTLGVVTTGATGGPSRSFPVPLSQAVRRLLPDGSAAVARLTAREDGHLLDGLAHDARHACEAAQR